MQREIRWNSVRTLAPMSLVIKSQAASRSTRKLEREVIGS